MNGGTTLRFGAAALSLPVLASVPTVAAAAPARPTQAAPAKAGPLSPRLAVLAGDAEEALAQHLFTSAEYLDRVS